MRENEQIHCTKDLGNSLCKYNDFSSFCKRVNFDFDN